MTDRDKITTDLEQLSKAQSVDDVFAICPPIPGTSDGAAEGFWELGYDDFEDALDNAGWITVWQKASYYWAKRAPDGSEITYIEGDLYRGRVQGAAQP